MKIVSKKEKEKMLVLVIELVNTCLESDRDSTVPHFHSLQEFFKKFLCIELLDYLTATAGL